MKYQVLYPCIGGPDETGPEIEAGPTDAETICRAIDALPDTVELHTLTAPDRQGVRLVRSGRLILAVLRPL